MNTTMPAMMIDSYGAARVSAHFSYKGHTYEAIRFNLGKIEVYLRQHKDAEQAAWAARWVGYADEVSLPLAKAADRALGGADLAAAIACLA